MSNSCRRAYARILFENSAVISTEKAREISTILTDVSAGGAGLVSNVPFDIKEKVEIRISPCFIFKDILRKKAKVAWCKKLSPDLWNVGLDFGVDNLLNFS
jgi:c-di-GMP-binding flagellar brake protein YcgR